MALKILPTVDLESRSGLHPEFLKGYELFKRYDMAGAQKHFRHVMSNVSEDDPNHHFYTSYFGLAQVYDGKHDGITHCRRAGSYEHRDGEVFVNLALGEINWGDRRRAVKALTRGFHIEPGNHNLHLVQRMLGVRRAPAVKFLSRDNFLNRLIGKWTYRKPRGTVHGRATYGAA